MNNEIILIGWVDEDTSKPNVRRTFKIEYNKVKAWKEQVGCIRIDYSDTIVNAIKTVKDEFGSRYYFHFSSDAPYENKQNVLESDQFGCLKSFLKEGKVQSEKVDVRYALKKAFKGWLLEGGVSDETIEDIRVYGLIGAKKHFYAFDRILKEVASEKLYD